ncbi:unnamed protein product, partial [Aureobasidium mustum]
PPAAASNESTAYDGSQSWCGSNGDAIAYHRRSPLTRGPYINDRSSSDRDGRAAKDSSEKPRDQDGLDIFGGCGAESESSTNKWRPKHGPEGEAENEEAGPGVGNLSFSGLGHSRIWRISHKLCESQKSYHAVSGGVPRWFAQLSVSFFDQIRILISYCLVNIASLHTYNLSDEAIRRSTRSSSMSGLLQSHVQVPTCIHCRQRRVKCDRQHPQCSNCLRSEVSCVYPPGRGRAPKRPRRNLTPQLAERLTRLEKLVGEVDISTIRTSQKTSQSDQDAEQSLDQDFSRLKVDESRSYYVNNALWVTLSNELRDLLFEPAIEDAGYDDPAVASSTTTTAISPSCSQLGLNTAIFGHHTLALPLHHYYPSLSQAPTLFAAFSENVAPLVRIFHMPTLTKTYWDTVTSIDSVDKHTEALLFAIHYSAVISLSSEQCSKIMDDTREAISAKYRFAVEQAFAQGNLLGTQSMTLLQAAVLFLSALPNEEDSRAAWALTSLVFHIARTMGLHRDGTVFGLKPFETELRRRLWWQICIIDSRSSEYHCNEPIALGLVTDTKPPLHINDDDLSSELLQPPAERWDSATDMTLSLVRCETIQTGWKLSRIKHKQNKELEDLGTLGSHESPDFSDERLSLIQGLESRLRDKYLPICDSSVPIQLLASSVARIILGRFKLIAQYSGASREKESYGKTLTAQLRPKDNMRDELFETSIGILEASGILLTSKELMHFTWYSKTHIQWNAMTLVLSELCSRGQSSQCDRAWDCVQTVYEAWRFHGNELEETRLALWRPIRRLMAKVRYVREIQQTDPGQPSKSIRSTRAGNSIPCFLSPGEMSQPAMATFSSDWSEPLQQAEDSVLMPQTCLTGPYSVQNSYRNQPDALQGVLSTDTRDPFMDWIPQWPFADIDPDIESSLTDYDFVL